MSGVLNLLVAGSKPAVSIAHTTIFAVELQNFPTDAAATIIFRASGTYGGNVPYAGTWLNYGSASSYEIRYSPTGDAPTGSATATWLSLSTDRSWTLTETGVGIKSCSGTIEIRDASTLVVLDSATGALSVEVVGG